MMDAPMKELARRLADISGKGPIPAIGVGDTAVGMTLLSLLDIPYSSTAKPSFEGIVITARRGTKAKDVNRVNLFAKVPDWDISACKSSREIVERYGYDRDGARKLYCTVRARQKNSQGLRLEVDRSGGRLVEVHEGQLGSAEVAAWHLATLERKLENSHRASAWIVAVPSRRNEQDFFHFRYATFTSAPRVEEMPALIEQGTITMDHLIQRAQGSVVEKGPLFKIKPENVRSLFPTAVNLDLLAL